MSKKVAKAKPAFESSPRELEFARHFREILEAIPYATLLKFCASLAESIAGDSAREANFSSREWRESEENAFLHLVPPQIAIEVTPPASTKSLERFDLVVAVPPFEVFGRAICTLIFEFKLGNYDEKQLKSYAQLSPNSLVISIAKEIPGQGPIVEQHDAAGTSLQWVCQTWEHLFHALRSMMSGDPQPRISAPEEPGDLLLFFNDRIPGQDRLTFTIERFLNLIEARNLLPNRTLTLVVPKGKHSAVSLAAPTPYYAHSKGWRPGYRYIAVVQGNRLEEIHEVLDSVTTERIGDEAPAKPRGLDEGVWKDLCKDDSLRVSTLAPTNVTVPLGKKYVKVGPNGRAITFTFSHRYIDSPDELANFFSSPA